LQRYSERNAVFGYHFYRLLHQAENVKLLYNTEGNELGGGEMSRFVTQLRYELPDYNPAIRITEKVISMPPGKQEDIPLVIQKDKPVIERLHELANKGFSPTSLGRYLACSLQFYFAQVARLAEPVRIEETIDAATLGNMVHRVLELTYQPFLGGIASKNDLESRLPWAISRVMKVFEEKYPASELESGKNLLILKVAENMVKRFLLADIAFLSKQPEGIQHMEIVKLESDLEGSIQLLDPVTGEIFPVKLIGKADRIDSISGRIRVIDYKTGQVKDDELKIDEIALLRDHKKPAKLVQLLSYAWMFRQMNPAEASKEIVSGIVSMRMASRYLMNARIDKEESLSDAMLTDFESVLKDLLHELFDVSVPFNQTENTTICQYCAYQAICNRTIN
jgi:ATP-dependent helicase/DNAse subunit B